MTSKIFNNFDEAIADIPDEASIAMTALIGPGGIPQNLILALKNKGVKNLDVYGCPNFGYIGVIRKKPGFSLFVSPDILIKNEQVAKVHTTWGNAGPGEYSALSEAIASEKIEYEMIPMGVYSHKLRAGGNGTGAFFSDIGIGTFYEQGKETRVIDGKKYLLEYPIRAKFGFVRAHKADTMGNLVYKGTARIFNPLIAKACDVTIAEVDEIVEMGELGPEQIITPGIYIDRIVQIPEGGLR